MIRNVIFDMGQVLIHWSPSLLTAAWPLTQAEKALLHREVFAGAEWVALAHGSITEEAALEAICPRLPESLRGYARELVTAWWVPPLTPMEGMEELLRELKARGLGLYVLSNANLRLRQYFPRIPGSDCFTGIMVSAEEKLLKPQHAIYHRLLERFGLRAAACFFIEDSTANIEAAA